MHQLRYGESAVLQVDVPSEALIADCTQIKGEVIGDVAAAVSAALAAPLDFPPLAAAVVPGDRVVIALDPDVPQRAEIVAGIVNSLLETEIEPGNIIVLQAEEGPGEVPLRAQLQARGLSVEVVVHAPSDPAQLAYLAASKDAQPIMLNRQLCEAEVVLPVSLLRPESALGYVGPHGGLCTAFSDKSTQDRFRIPLSALPEREQRRRRAEADEVAWLLGIQLTVQIVAGAGDTVLHVLAGQVDEVCRQGGILVDEAWSHHIPQRAQLVVATIEGGQGEQNWANFGRALHAAQQVCAENGTIILCTALTCGLGPSLQRLSRISGRRAAEKTRTQRSHGRRCFRLVTARRAKFGARVFVK